MVDFNAVRKKEERVWPCNPSDTQLCEIDDSNDFCSLMDLFDLPMIGGNFTWYKSAGSAKSRLDKILLLED